MPTVKAGVFLTTKGLEDLIAELREIRDEIAEGLLCPARAVGRLEAVLGCLMTAKEQDEGQMGPQLRRCGNG